MHDPPDGRGFKARLGVVALTGVAWATRSLQALADPAYTDPVTPFDWLAVVGFSAAFLLTAGGLLVLRESVRPALNVAIAIAVVALACVVAGLANLLEDGLGVNGVGTIFAVAALVFWIGLFVVAGMLFVSPDRSLAFLPALTGVGFALFEIGGGLLILAGWLAFARILVRRRRRAGRADGAG